MHRHVRATCKFMHHIKHTKFNMNTPKSLPTTLSDWLEYISKIHVSAIDMGLERVLPIAEHLQILPIHLQKNGQKKPYVFMVSGTNGKGSTTATIAQICQTAGYKTALYQSPHLIDFTERARIDGQNISEKALMDAFLVVEDARQKLGLTLSFFEMTTLATFWWFAKQDCDVWVLEVGLGGRLDVVNIVDADVCTITNIGLDHIDWLGDDLEQIGQEKAGIIKKNCVCILAQDMPKSVYQIAKSTARVVRMVDAHYSTRALGKAQFIYSSAAHTLVLPMPKLSLINVAAAITAVLESAICTNVTHDVLAVALKNLHLAGRFDIRTLKNRHFLFDVAHNSAGVQFLLAQFVSFWKNHKKHHPTARLFVLFSMLADKDIDAVLAHIKQVFTQENIISIWHTAPINNVRALDAKALVQHTQAFSAVMHNDLSAAATAVVDYSTPEDLILVFGSFHTISEVLCALDVHRFGHN